MALQKTYNRINWENYPSEETALNATNLNRTDYAINEIDDRVIALDTEKLDKTTSYGLITNVELDNTTGILTVTYLNGTVTTYQTVLNKVAVNFRFDQTTQSIEITNEDGSKETVDLSAFVTQYEFSNTSTIAFTNTSGVISANIVEGSIGERYLRPNYLSDIKVSEANALQSEVSAEASAILSKSWAVGDTNGSRIDEDTNNSKYYSQLSESSAIHCDEVETRAQELLNAAISKVTDANFYLDFSTGMLMYESTAYGFHIDYNTGNLMWEVD